MSEKQKEVMKNAMQLLPDARRARDMTTEHREHELDRLADPVQGATLWDLYERDASVYLDEMEKMFPGTKAMFEKCKAELKAAGAPLVFAEFAGAADASTIGADVTISAVLQEDIGMPKKDNQIIVAGDLTRSKTQRALMEVLRKHAPISLIVFQPIGAASAYAGNLFAYEQISSLLSESAPLLAAYGQVLINLDRIRNPIPIRKAYEGIDVVIEEAPASTTFKHGIDEWKAMNVFRVYRNISDSPEKV